MISGPDLLYQIGLNSDSKVKTPLFWGNFFLELTLWVFQEMIPAYLEIGLQTIVTNWVFPHLKKLFFVSQNQGKVDSLTD